MRQVIVTRPAREAAHWVQQLQAKGLQAVALPLIAIGPCNEVAAQQAIARARARLTHYRAVMFVSANAVVYFFESNQPVALINKALTATIIRAWAPGPGTARALLSAGFLPSDIDSPAADALQFDSEALWQQVAQQVQPNDKVLIVRGRSGDTSNALIATTDQAIQGTGRDWLARQIEAAGAQVEFVVAYERKASTLSPTEIMLAQRAAQDGSLWLLSSSEAVAYLAKALPMQSWAHAQALVTHPRIAQAARNLGFGTVQECRPALSDVIASIESTP